MKFDLYWGITRSPSVVIEGYNEDAAPIKNKPHKRRVGVMKFMPYGERASEDAKRTKYVRQLNSLAAELLGRAVAAGATHLEKVSTARRCQELTQQWSLRTWLIEGKSPWKLKARCCDVICCFRPLFSLNCMSPEVLASEAIIPYNSCDVPSP